MAVSDEQAKQLKEQLMSQIENVPEDKREEIKAQIENMTNDQLEAFLKKNQEMDSEQASSCVFCSIVQGKTPSIKIDENEEAIAVLDINPISKGHVLIIPREHDLEPTEKSQELAFSVGGRIMEKLSPKDITTRGAKVMGHTIFNVIPIYEDTDLEKRIKLEKKDFDEVSDLIKNPDLKDEAPAKVEVKKEEKPKVLEQPKPEDTQIVEGEDTGCAFCSIAQHQAASFQIDENKDNVAVLEVNPISKGHTLVVPKEHKDTTGLPSNSFTLAKKIAKKIKTKYKANDVKINPTTLNNHAVIELIPIYNDTNLTQRSQAKQQELITMQSELMVKKSAPKQKPKVEKKEESEESSAGEKKKEVKKADFGLKKKPKYPDLKQYGPKIP